MKTKIVIGGFLLSIIPGVCVFMWSRPFSAPVTATPPGEVKETFGTADHSPSNQEAADISSMLTPQQKELLASGHLLAAEERQKLLLKKRWKDLAPTWEELGKMGDTPVEFYGQVLDQFDQPVVGTKIRCTWAFMGPQSAGRELLSSVPEGRFKILNLKALFINVFVYPPPGYVQIPESDRKIQFAEIPERIRHLDYYQNMAPEQKEAWGKVHGFGEAHKPDKANPVIFRLKKL